MILLILILDSKILSADGAFVGITKIKTSSKSTAILPAVPSFRRNRIFSSILLSSPSSVTSDNLDSDSERNRQKQVQEQSSSTTIKKRRRRHVSLLVCPAQFCVPDDYTVLFETIKEQLLLLNNNNNNNTDIIELGTCVVCPLPRTEWIKVSKQLPTKNFIQGTLNVQDTLDWYFNSIEAAASTIVSTEMMNGYTFTQDNNNKDENDIDNTICIIGHSIGGWVARAYLGGMSLSSTSISKILIKSCTSLITLGTPHINSPTGLVDQTRGLINSIDATVTCSPQYITNTLGIDITCVCSNGISASIFPLNIEQLIAIGSYVPLVGPSILQFSNSNINDEKDIESSSDNTKREVAGNGGSGSGDGIVPIQLAFLSKPSKHVIIQKCLETNDIVRHSHVLPTPWNLLNGYQSSILLPYPSYVSSGVVSQWIQYIK
jgi:PGAP1-like protein